MHTFNLHVEHGIRIDDISRGLQDDFCQTFFVVFFDAEEIADEFGIRGIGFQLFQIRQLCNPRIADFGRDQVCQFGVGAQQPTARRNAVCFVVEAFRPHFVEVRSQSFFDQFRMDGSDAVDGMRTDNCQITHTDFLFRTFFDDGHAAHFFNVARIEFSDFFHQVVIDVIDNDHVPGHDFFQQFDGPTFKSFGQQGVVCVAHGFFRDFPRRIPIETVDVHQDAHQFGDSQSRMRIVELDGCFFGQFAQIRVCFQETAHNIADGAGYEEVLLHQAQFLTGFDGVGGVKDFGDCFGFDFLFNGFDITAFVKGFDIQFVGRSGREQTQIVDGFSAVTDDGHVIGNADDGFGIDPSGISFSVNVFIDDASVHGDAASAVAAFDLPRGGTVEPRIGAFFLITVFKILFEQTELIIDAVTVSGQTERCHGIDKAGGQSSQAAVSQSGIVFAIDDVTQGDGVIELNLIDQVMDAQIVEVVDQRAPQQVFNGQVIDSFRVDF